MTDTKRAALYLRVSTDDQTTENQRQALRQEAERRGWNIVAEYEDAGISGAKGRDKRPGLDNLLKDATRGKFDVVMSWAVDRLGRSLADLISTLNDLQASNVDLFLHQQALDTTTPSGRAMFGMLGVFSEFERSMIRARIRAGLDRARREGRTGGRPRLAHEKVQQIRNRLARGDGVLRTAKALGVGTATVQTIKRRMQSAQTSIAPASTSIAPASTA